jgi:hypothetical protein
VIGFDVERHDYGTGGYPGQLVLQNVLTLHGSQFRDATCIVASPPCQEFSYMAMPWTRAKQIKRGLRGEDDFPKGYTGSHTIAELTALLNECFRIQREACEATCHCECWRCKRRGHCVRCDGYCNTGTYARHIPLVVENVKGAQPWVGRAAWHFGSFYLWGDVPALMPIISGHRKSQHMALCETPEGTGSTSWFFGNSKHEGRYYGTKNDGGSWFNVGSPGQTNVAKNPDGRKVTGLDWSKYGQEGYKARGFNVTAAQRYREDQNSEGLKFGGGWWHDSTNNLIRKASSKSSARKAASAQIAKIPFPLANWIARCFRDERAEAAS